MNQPINKTSVRNAMLSILISIVMILVSGGLMLFAHLSEGKSQVFDNVKFEQVKQQLRDNPDDESLQWSVRELDRRMRNDYIFSRKLADNSRYLLVISFLALVVSARVYVYLRYEPSVPDDSDCNCSQLQARVYSSYGMLAVIVFFALGSSFYLISGIGHSESDSGANLKVSYASIDTQKENWHRFRGFAGSGVVDFDDIVLEFDLETGENIIWSVETELRGFNSPIIFEDKIFFSGANELVRKVYCLNLADGDLLWSANVDIPDRADDTVPDVMEDTGFAAPSMATDGELVYSIFANGDMACHDFEGQLKWQMNLGLPESSYGYSASLDVWQGNVLVQYDQGYDEASLVSKALSINGQTGNINWQIKRPVINSWTSPTIAFTGGKWQFITVSNPLAISYDPTTGRELWRFGDLYGDTAPSPVVTDELTFLVSPYQDVKAVYTYLSGDISDTEPVWVGTEGIPDTTSPVTNGEKLWLLTMDGQVTCYNISDGQKRYDFTISDFCYASPTLVKDKMLFFSMAGKYYIADVASDEPEIVFQVDFSEQICSSPAFVDGKMIVRTDTKIFCIGKK